MTNDGTPLATYLLESYVPRLAHHQPRLERRRLRRAATALAARGVSVRYLRTIAVPADDICFHVLAGASAADVELVAELAGVAVTRVSEADELRSEGRTR